MRTRFLFLMLLCIVLLAGCQEDTVPGYDELNAIPQSAEENLRLQEAPMLTRLVQKGQLPPLEERLPEHPLVVPVVEQLGYYGGVWRRYHTSTSLSCFRLINSYTPLARWDADVTEIIPGLAESWEFSPDGRIITFYLRKGIRWSDGEPFTSRDILYWWELCINDQVGIFPPEWAFVNQKRMEVEAPEPHIIRFIYDDAFYFMPIFMATGFWVPESILIPFHHMKQFDPDYTDQYQDYEIFLRKNTVWDNPDRPTLSPWRLIHYSKTGDRVVYERNPYFCGVDSAGRQLPYIDRVESLRVQSSESGVMMIISGGVDAQFRLINLSNYALLDRFAEKHDYRILRWEEGTAAWYSVCINWSVDDPDKRELFRNKLFRRALAVAIDREKINQIVWHGLSRPQAGAITDEAWHFQSEKGQEVLQRWITEWSQYDPDLANDYLDQCGLQERDRENFRMYQGKPFQVLLEFYDDHIAADEATLIMADWEKVGIRTLIRRSVGSDLWTRVRLGKFEMYLQHNSEMDLFSFPAWVFPTANINWHPRIGRWYMTGGTEGEKPEGFMADLLEIYDRCKKEPDLEKRHQLVLDAIQIHFEEGPFFLGTCGRQPDLVIVKNNFRNVPTTGILGPLAICQPGSKWPEQFYIDPYTGRKEAE